MIYVDWLVLMDWCITSSFKYDMISGRYKQKDYVKEIQENTC